MESTPVVIIGGGPAGLASSATLRQRGVDSVILERGDTVAPAWHRHYERLHLHTQKGASGLPGLPMPKSYPQFPSRDQVADYLTGYADHAQVDVRLGTEVETAERQDDGWVTTTTDGQAFRSEHVIVATGLSHTPRIPKWPGMDEFDGTILHSNEYRNGTPWEGKDALVVGFGNSAGEIALDLAEHGARANLSVRHKSVVVPRAILGIPILTIARWLSIFPPRVADFLSKPLLALLIGDISKVGLPAADWGPLEQIATKGKVPLLDVGTMKALKEGSIKAHPGVERFTADGVVFTDGTQLACDVVVLGTGYIPAVEEVIAEPGPAVDEDGHPVVSGAKTPVEGLWFVGFREPPTGRIREIGIEAERVAEAIAG